MLSARATSTVAVLLVGLTGVSYNAGQDETFLTVARHDRRSRPSDRSTIAVSSDGRFVAFTSYAPLSEADSHDLGDVYVLDRQTGGVTLEKPALGFGSRPETTTSLSAEGRYLTFEALDTKSHVVIILRDRWTGGSRVLTREGAVPDGDDADAVISARGDVVAFSSTSTTVVDGQDANGRRPDVYAVALPSMRFERVSVDSRGQQPLDGASLAPAISADGRFVAFTSTASLDTSVRARRGVPNIYLRDREHGTTSRVSVTTTGDEPNGASYQPAISADGRYVAFVSEATNLVRTPDRNHAPDVVLRDTVENVTELISRCATGGTANGASSHPAISGDGRYVVFQSDASDLVCAARCPPEDRDINLVADIFVRDRELRVTRRISRDHAGWAEPSVGPAIDATGGVIAFSSRHPMDAFDDRDDFDLFIWTRRNLGRESSVVPSTESGLRHERQ
jgi:Tol biopolymer transport system component